MIILSIATVFYSSDSVPLESVVICCTTVATLNMLCRDDPPVHSGTTDWLTDSQTDYADLSLCCLLKHFFHRPHLGLLGLQRLRLRISADCYREAKGIAEAVVYLERNTLRVGFSPWRFSVPFWELIILSHVSSRGRRNWIIFPMISWFHVLLYETMPLALRNIYLKTDCLLAFM
jgi:hypothetical protein